MWLAPRHRRRGPFRWWAMASTGKPQERCSPLHFCRSANALATVAPASAFAAWPKTAMVGEPARATRCDRPRTADRESAEATPTLSWRELFFPTAWQVVRRRAFHCAKWDSDALARNALLPNGGRPPPPCPPRLPSNVCAGGALWETGVGHHPAMQSRSDRGRSGKLFSQTGKRRPHKASRPVL